MSDTAVHMTNMTSFNSFNFDVIENIFYEQPTQLRTVYETHWN